MATIDRVSILVTEEVDCCGPVDKELNEIEISTEDGGGGVYAVIKTERWAIDLDGPDEFMDLIRKVIHMCEEPKK